ncbi:putative ribonuclease H-like domain-containing protein [Tanacetum coccineum]
MNVSLIPTTRIHKDHPKEQIIWDPLSAPQTRRMIKYAQEHAMNPRRNKKDERGIVVRNKARLVAQGYTPEEGIDYDEVFAHVARIEAIRLFLAYASFIGFIVYQIDMKSAFLYGTIEEEPFTSEFTLEEIDAFLYDKSISLESDHDDCDPEEDIYVLKQLLNDDPFQLRPMDLKQSEVTEAKSSIEDLRT